MIRKVKNQFILYSQDGKKVLGKFNNRDQAKKREEEIERMAGDAEECAVMYPPDVLTFAQAMQVEAQMEAFEETMEYSEKLRALVDNILYAPIEDKATALRAVMDEFIALIQDVPEVTEASEDAAQLSECFAPVVTAFEVVEEMGKSDLLYIDTAIIEPGWGNVRDNNFYPREMLARDASRFVGAKMYETNHNEAEKNTRTWVSTITEIKGFTDSGAPIARVAVHDPNFAERMRNLNSAGILEKMECSILAGARVVPGFELAGRRGKRVEEITEVSSVDWVTRARAGGRAIALAESAEGADMPKDQELQEPIVETPVVEDAITPAPEDTQIEEVEPVTEQPEEAKSLTAERVLEALGLTKLPEPARVRLASGVYASEQALHEAITAEVNYISEITNAGKPFGLGESHQPAIVADVEEAEKRLNQINKKHLNF